jgi:hypothetical protein
MNRKQLIRTASIVAALAFLCPAAPRADDAKDEYDRGVAAFTEERYEEAADAFRKAHELKPSWKLFFNIGQSEAAAKRSGLALESFESYLAQGGDDVPEARREEVLVEVERLRKMVGMAKIHAPEGATVFVDGVERGEAPLLGKIPVAAGIKHTAWVVMNGSKLQQKAFKVTGGDTVTVDLAAKVDKDSAPVEPAPEPIDPGESDEESSGMVTAGWVAVGVGGALLIGGAITGGMALNLDSDLDHDCPDESCFGERQSDIDKLNTLSLTTDILMGVGAAVAVTGIVLLIVGHKKKGANEEPVALAPAFAPGFTGAVIQGRF